jgi:predicted heme/steroid binding protein
VWRALACARDDAHRHGVTPFRPTELSRFRGEDGAPIYIGVRGVVFDMTSMTGRLFYGPSGAYHCFAGRDATIGLATMELDPKRWSERTLASLKAAELDTLNQWVRAGLTHARAPTHPRSHASLEPPRLAVSQYIKYETKYPVLGYLTDGVEPKSVATHGAAAGAAGTAGAGAAAATAAAAAAPRSMCGGELFSDAIVGDIRPKHDPLANLDVEIAPDGEPRVRGRVT